MVVRKAAVEGEIVWCTHKNGPAIRDGLRAKHETWSSEQPCDYGSRYDGICAHHRWVQGRILFWVAAAPSGRVCIRGPTLSSRS